MPNRTEIFATLAQVLSNVYFSHESAGRIARQAGIDLAYVAVLSTPIDYWDEIINKADLQGCLDRLVEKACEEHDKWLPLLQVRQDYVEWVQAGRPDDRPDVQLRPTPPVEIPKPPRATRLFGREHFIHDLATELCDPAVDTPLALCGAAGIGKTALALNVANHADVQAAFPGGRAWIELGPEPAVFDLLGRVLQQFGFHPGPELISEALRADRLRDVLAGRRCLLVLDDVWQASAARPFLYAGQSPAHVLFTTRSAQLAADLHAANHDVRVLKPGPAVEMLAAAGQDAAQAVTSDPTGAEHLAHDLGYLPLALHVAGRQLNRLTRADGPRRAVAQLRANLVAERRRVLTLRTAESRPGLEDVEPTLEAVIALSYDRLPDGDSRWAFCRLAVFGGQPLSFDANAMAAVCEVDAGLALDFRMAMIDLGSWTWHDRASLMERHPPTARHQPARMRRLQTCRAATRCTP